MAGESVLDLLFSIQYNMEQVVIKSITSEEDLIVKQFFGMSQRGDLQ